MDSLIERIEGAKACSREFDEDIAVALNLCQRRDGYLYAWSEAGSTNEAYSPPCFTASLDAAMTLVPDHVSVKIITGGTLKTMAACFTGARDGWAASNAATPALALCAAALKARTINHG